MAHNLRVYGIAVHGVPSATPHPKTLRVYGMRVVAGASRRVLRVYGMQIVKDATEKKLRVYGMRVVSSTQPEPPVQRKVGGLPVTISLFRKSDGSQVEIT